MSLNSQSGFTKEKKDFGTAEKSTQSIDPPRRGCSKSLASESSQLESSSDSPVVEKTLYVDSVHKIKSSSACSSDNNHKGDDFDTSRKDTDLDKSIRIDYSIEESKNLSIVDEKAVLQPKSSASLNSNDDLQMELKNHPNKICPEEQELTKPNYQGNNLDQALVAFSSPATVESKKIESESKVFSIKEGSKGPVSWRNKKFTSDLKFDSEGQSATKVFDQECTLKSSEDPSTLTCSRVVSDTKIDLQSQLYEKKLGHGETLNVSSIKHPLALPSPKAPSESWLKRTLPTVSSKNILSRSNLAANLHAPTQLKDPKWERIVKSSKSNHGHLQFAEVLY